MKKQEQSYEQECSQYWCKKRIVIQKWVVKNSWHLPLPKLCRTHCIKSYDPLVHDAYEASHLRWCHSVGIWTAITQSLEIILLLHSAIFIWINKQKAALLSDHPGMLLKFNTTGNHWNSDIPFCSSIKR